MTVNKQQTPQTGIYLLLHAQDEQHQEHPGKREGGGRCHCPLSSCVEVDMFPNASTVSTSGWLIPRVPETT